MDTEISEGGHHIVYVIFVYVIPRLQKITDFINFIIEIHIMMT